MAISEGRLSPKSLISVPAYPHPGASQPQLTTSMTSVFPICSFTPFVYQHFFAPFSVDPSKLSIAFNKDQAIQSPLSQTDTILSSGGIFGNFLSTIGWSMSSTPFVVTNNMSKGYYKGLPSNPPLIATTHSSPIEPPSGPKAYSILKELRVLGNHPLASIWDKGLATNLCHCLNTVCVNWTSIDTLLGSAILLPSHVSEWNPRTPYVVRTYSPFVSDRFPPHLRTYLSVPYITISPSSLPFTC